MTTPLVITRPLPGRWYWSDREHYRYRCEDRYVIRVEEGHPTEQAGGVVYYRRRGYPTTRICSVRAFAKWACGIVHEQPEAA